MVFHGISPKLWRMSTFSFFLLVKKDHHLSAKWCRWDMVQKKLWSNPTTFDPCQTFQVARGWSWTSHGWAVSGRLTISKLGQKCPIRCTKGLACTESSLSAASSGPFNGNMPTTRMAPPVNKTSVDVCLQNDVAIGLRNIPKNERKILFWHVHLPGLGGVYHPIPKSAFPNWAKWKSQVVSTQNKKQNCIFNTSPNLAFLCFFFHWLLTTHLPTWRLLSSTSLAVNKRRTLKITPRWPRLSPPLSCWVKHVIAAEKSKVPQAPKGQRMMEPGE